MNLTNVVILGTFCIVSVASVVLFRHGYETIGLEMNLRFLLKWASNPSILLALLSALVCRILFYMMLKQMSMSIAFLVVMLSSVFVLAAGALIFNDSLTVRQLFGAVLILAGVGCVGI